MLNANMDGKRSSFGGAPLLFAFKEELLVVGCIQH
jgi:hypothetical protein